MISDSAAICPKCGAVRKISGRDTSESIPKDHAEHLRQIHFALLATVAVLAAFLLGHTDYTPAYNQLTEVRKIAANWDPDALHQSISKNLEASNRFVGSNLYYGFFKGNMRSTHRGDVKQLSLLSSPYLALESFDRKSSARSQTETNRIRIEPPQTLGDFRRIWDQLTYPLPVALLSKVSKRVFLMRVLNGKVFDKTEISSDLYVGNDLLKIVKSNDPGEDPSYINLYVIDGIFSRIDNKKFSHSIDEFKEVATPRQFGGMTGEWTSQINEKEEAFALEYNVDRPSERLEVTMYPDPAAIPKTNWLDISFPFPSGERVLIACTAVTNKFSWMPSSYSSNSSNFNERFEFVFPDLARLGDKYDEFTLNKVDRELKAELGLDSTRAINVLGLQVPAQLVGRVGPGIVVLIQIYFVFHICAINGIVSAIRKDEVPFILLYRGFLSFLFSHVTTWVVPALVCVTIVWKSNLGWLLKFVYIGGEFLLCCILAFALWRLRRKICDSSGRPEGDLEAIRRFFRKQK